MDLTKMNQLVHDFIMAHQMLPIYLLGGMILFMFGWFAYVIYQTIKTEKRGKEFRKTLKTTDKVWFSRQGSVEGEIIETDAKGDGEFVAVKVIVRKKSVYPDSDTQNQLNRA